MFEAMYNVNLGPCGQNPSWATGATLVFDILLNFHQILVHIGGNYALILT